MSTLRADKVMSTTDGIPNVKGHVIYVDTIADLQALPTSKLVDGQQVQVKEYHAGTGVGGGEFYWNANLNKAGHDGGLIIDPDQTFPSDWGDTSQQEAWFNAVGTATGCFVRPDPLETSLSDFGAKPETDATLSAFWAIRGGRSIQVHAYGTYFVDGLIISGQSNFELYGKGTLSLKSGGTTRVIGFRDCENFEVHGLTFDGNKANRTAPADRNDGAGILVVAGKSFRIYNNEVRNCISGAGILCIDDGSTDADLMTGGMIYNNYVHDLGVIGGSAAELCDGMFINSDNSGVYHNTIENTSDYGIAGDYSTNLSIAFNKIRNVLIGIGVLGAHGWKVIGNSITTAGQGVSITLSGNAAVFPYLSSDVVISGNNIKDISKDASGTPNGDAIYTDPSAKNVKVTDNYIDGCFRGVIADTQGVVVSGNTVNDSVDVSYFVSGVNANIIGNAYTGVSLRPYINTFNGKIYIDSKDQEWKAVSSFSGGWSNVGSPFSSAEYKTVNGVTHLRGAIKGGTTSPGQPVLSIPSQYAPSDPAKLVCADGNSGIAVVTINPDGALVFSSTTGTGAEINLNSIKFSAK